jgi:hypothetical protein
MIDIKKILKRAWHILWNYRVLWVFGFLLALTSGGAGGGNSGSSYQAGSSSTSGNDFNFQPGPFWNELTRWFDRTIAPLFESPAQHVATFIWIGVVVLLFLLITGVVAAFLRYVSETAVIRMVDEYEQSGTKVGFKAGWRLGWDRRAFRLWLIDLVISLPVILFLLFLVLIGLLVFFSVTSGNTALMVIGVVAATGFVLLFALVLVVGMVFLSLLRQFFVRAAALEESGIRASFCLGWDIFKRHWQSAALMWLAMVGVGILFSLGGILLVFLLIPVFLVLLLPAALVAAIPGGVAFGIASIFASGPPAWIAAALVALLPFLLILFSPLILLSGGYLVYTSSVWTLTYRELKALAAAKTPELPA